MPNHVQNSIQLQGDEEKIREMLEAIQDDEEGFGTVDFNKIIPMPESMKIEAGSRTDRGLKLYQDFIDVYTLTGTLDKDLTQIPRSSEEAFLRARTESNNAVDPQEWELGKTAWQNIRQYGSPTWYEWSICHWGTKWNAYSQVPFADQEEHSCLCFQTAWSAPHPVLEKLAEMYPEVVFEHEWADEDLGVNCGRHSYYNGERMEEYYPESNKDCMEFACSVWDHDPEDFDLFLNKTGNAYIYTEKEQYELIELFGKPALFSNSRITSQDIPRGLYSYDLRHGDDGRFCSVEPKVAVNHGGSIIMREPLDFGEQKHLTFTEDTEPNFLGTELTMGAYMRGEFELIETESGQLGGMQL